MRNKKGVSVAWGFIIIFLSLFVAMFLGLAVYGFDLATTTLGQDVEVGQVNLQDITNKTLGQLNTGMLNNADTIGIILLFGMVLLMMLNGFYTARNLPKLFFIVDIFLLILFFIPAIYVSQLYETFINVSIFNNVFTITIAKTSKFMLNLPSIIATAGVLTMILTYTGIRRDSRRGEDFGQSNF